MHRVQYKKISDKLFTNKGIYLRIVITKKEETNSSEQTYKTDGVLLFLFK